MFLLSVSFIVLLLLQKIGIQVSNELKLRGDGQQWDV